MRRALLVITFAFVLSGCLTEGEPYELLTHCGLEETPITFDGERWRAVGPGPLSDGSGNPPPGFSNPTDQGTIRRTGIDSALYVSSQGIPLELRRVEGSPPPFICF